MVPSHPVLLDRHRHLRAMACLGLNLSLRIKSQLSELSLRAAEVAEKIAANRQLAPSGMEPRIHRSRVTVLRTVLKGPARSEPPNDAEPFCAEFVAAWGA